MSDTTADTDELVIVLNPRSGSADHVDAVEKRAAIRGYDVRETTHEGHALELARIAAQDGRQQVVAAGGDGTLNEVIRGIAAADALDSVTVGVIPCGTGNNFATNVGIADIDEAFTVLEEGERRRLDLGWAGDRPFINSCVGGLTADASAETDPELKSQLGVLAYVLTTLQTVSRFDGLELSISVWDGEASEPVWNGNAACVLIGNGRRFAHAGSQQANVEDGLLNLTIVEAAPSIELVGDRLQERLFGTDGEHITRLLASAIELDLDESTSLSLDGEMIEYDALSVDVDRQALRFPVGRTYEPAPTLD